MSVLNRIISKVDFITLITLFILGIAALIFGLKLSNNRLEQVSIIMILAPSIYYIIRNKITIEDISFKFFDSKELQFMLSTLFFILLIACIFIFNMIPYNRPLSFLILVSIMTGIIAIQIVSTENKFYYSLILSEILILAILIRATDFYQFSTVIGGDPWTHMSYIESIITSGHINLQMKSYTSFPLMHLFVVNVYNFTGLNSKDSMFFISLASVLALILIFIIIKKIFGEKFALMSTLFLSAVSVHSIQYGFLIIPQTFGIVILCLMLFFVFSQKIDISLTKKRVYGVSLLISIIAMILTHTLMTYAAFFIIVSIFMTDLIKNWVIRIKTQNIRHFNYISITFIAFFFVFMISYWMNEAGMIGYIGESIKWAFSVSYQAPSVSTLKESFTTTAIKMLPLYIFLTVSILGFFYSLWGKYFKSIALYGWLIVLFVFSTFFLGMDTFLPARWFVVMEFVLIVPFTIGILVISNILNSNYKKSIFLFFIVFSLTFVSVTNYEATSDSVNPFTPSPTQGMKYSEEVALGTLINESTNTTYLYTDLGYKNNYITKIKILDASKLLAGKDTLNEVAIKSNKTIILLFRGDLMKNPYYTSYLGGGHYSIVLFDHSILLKLNDNSKVYDSGSVFAFEGG